MSTYSVVSKNGIHSRVSHFLKAMDIYACPSDKNRRGQQRQPGLQWASESKSSITIIRNYKKTIRKIEHQTSKKYYTIYIINTILLIMAPCSVEEKVCWRNHSYAGLIINQPSLGSSPSVLLRPIDAERHNLSGKLTLNIYYNFSNRK